MEVSSNCREVGSGGKLLEQEGKDGQDEESGILK